MAASLVAQLVINVPLWRDRPSGPPTVPLLSWLSLPEPGGLVLWSLMLAALALVIAGKTVRLAAIAIAVGYALMCLLDQTRLQPHNTVCPALLLIATSKAMTPQESLRGVRLALAGIYFFAGLSKLNAHYANLVHPGMMEGIMELAPSWLDPLFAFPWSAPVSEMLVGLAVFYPGPWRTRRFVFVGALAMHAFIMTMLLVASHDPTVIPFNGGLALCAFAVLFDPAEADPQIRLRSMGRTFGGKVAVAYGIVLPVLSVIGLADLSMGHTMYTGVEARMRWYVSEEARGRLLATGWPEKLFGPAKVPPGARPLPDGMHAVNVHGWIYRGLKQGLIAEARTADAMKTRLCEVAARSPHDVVVRFYGTAHPITGDRKYRDADCDGSLGFWLRFGGIRTVVIGGEGEVFELEQDGAPEF